MMMSQLKKRIASLIPFFLFPEGLGSRAVVAGDGGVVGALGLGVAELEWAGDEGFQRRAEGG